jgi:N-acetylmuramoyl-L-alanine amidase
MGAPGRPWFGWRPIRRSFTILAAAVLAPALATAQSSEISKTFSFEQTTGQTEIRKSRPRVDGSQRTDPAESNGRTEAYGLRAVPPEHEASAEFLAHAATATQAEVTGDAALTRFSLILSARVRYHVSSLANPYRIVIDMPDVDFRLPVTAGQRGHGLVRAYRYGLFAPGKARVVIDTTRPVRVRRHLMNVNAADRAVHLVLDLEPTDQASFLAAVALSPPVRHHEPHAADDAGPAPASTRPVVVIDPGHGGPDPGAVAGFREKDVVLAVARQVYAMLEALDRFDVYMTRSTDVFIPLGQRVAFSRRKRASLFVSIHANSVPEHSTAADIVRGAAVYTLSEEASTREAKRLAENENAADLLAGGESRIETVNEVDRILADLKWRETSEFSADFRGRLLTHLKGATTLSREPAPSAAFMVLRQGDCPSVLVELGYVSNAKDAQLLVSPDWQQRVAHSIAAAINDYFTTRGRRP